jgi:hypothetical protein
VLEEGTAYGGGEEVFDFERGRGAAVDPEFDEREGFWLGAGFAFGRHVVVVGDGQEHALKERAFFGGAGDEGGAVFAAFEELFEGVEAQFAFLFFGAVAVDAVFF